MKRLFLSACCLLTFSLCRAQADGISNYYASQDSFGNAELLGSGRIGCTPSDTGSFEYSCEKTEIGDIQGYFNASDFGSDRWGTILHRYWTSAPNEFLKFSATACARGNEDAATQEDARFFADRALQGVVRSFSSNILTGQYQPLSYSKYDERYVCVQTKRPEGFHVGILADKPIDPPAGSQIPAATLPPIQDAGPTSLENPETMPEPGVIKFDVLSHYHNTLNLIFETQDKSRIWPDSSQAYILPTEDDKKFRLACTGDEYICYGAVNQSGTLTFGAGNGQAGCTDCCRRCGFYYHVEFNDANDPVTSSNETSNNFGDLLGAAAGLGQIAAGMRNNAPAPTYQLPSRPLGGGGGYQAPSTSSSGISCARAAPNC